MGEIAAQALYVPRHLRARGSQLRNGTYGIVNMTIGRRQFFLEAVKDPQRLGLAYAMLHCQLPVWFRNTQLAAYGWPLNLAVSRMRLIMRSVISYAH